ncbi:hypothetical protein LCGC14_0896030 [marine sediment metagenome]|uniref:Uncharacterized protein n=1 Tax=marine sediment metagenome TaxID=412755 RepID=A0A0F9P2R7_9ZZZZ
MKNLCTLLLAAFLFYLPLVATASAQTPTLTLTTPAQPAPVATSYVLGEMKINWLNDYVGLTLMADNGDIEHIPLSGPEGLSAISAINLSSKNLRRMILQHLITIGKFDGTVAE